MRLAVILCTFCLLLSTARAESPNASKIVEGYYARLKAGGLTPEALEALGPLTAEQKRLAGIVLEDALQAWDTQASVVCKSNLKNLATALEMWSTDNAGRYPPNLAALTPDYLLIIPGCPSADSDTYSSSYQVAANPDAFTLTCSGSHHAAVGYAPNTLSYSSNSGLIDDHQPVGVSGTVQSYRVTPVETTYSKAQFTRVEDSSRWACEPNSQRHYILYSIDEQGVVVRALSIDKPGFMRDFVGAFKAMANSGDADGATKDALLQALHAGMLRLGPAATGVAVRQLIVDPEMAPFWKKVLEDADKPQ